MLRFIGLNIFSFLELQNFLSEEGLKDAVHKNWFPFFADLICVRGEGGGGAPGLPEECRLQRQVTTMG